MNVIYKTRLEGNKYISWFAGVHVYWSIIKQIRTHRRQLKWRKLEGNWFHSLPQERFCQFHSLPMERQPQRDSLGLSALSSETSEKAVPQCGVSSGRAAVQIPLRYFSSTEQHWMGELKHRATTFQNLPGPWVRLLTRYLLPFWKIGLQPRH